MSTNEGTSLRRFQPLLLTIRLSRQTRSGKFAALYYIRVGNGNGLEPGPWIARRVRHLKTVPGRRLPVAHGHAGRAEDSESTRPAGFSSYVWTHKSQEMESSPCYGGLTDTTVSFFLPPTNVHIDRTATAPTIIPKANARLIRTGKLSFRQIESPFTLHSIGQRVEDDATEMVEGFDDRPSSISSALWVMA